MEATAHRTERNVEAFYQRIIFDFMTQIQKRLEAKPMKQADLAERLGLTEGRVSQILNNPGDVVSLKKAIKLARAVGMKLALVAYDDKDPDNERGPVNSDIFRICWENVGRPRTFHLAQPRQIDFAFSSEARLVPAGRNAQYLILRNAYVNRPKKDSPYARIASGLPQTDIAAKGRSSIPFLITADPAKVISPGLLQGE